MTFLPVDEALRLANEPYYWQKGGKIYADFSTVAKCCPLVARADAADFVRMKKGGIGPLEIYDFGIGDGSFAFDFLDEVEKADEGIYGKLAYTLCDISAKLLAEVMHAERAKRHAGRLRTHEADAAGEFSFSADYVRSNEMYDDLPAKLFVMRKGRIYEVLVDVNGGGAGRVLKKRRGFEGELPSAMEKMLEMCEGRELACNFGALAHLRNAMRALHAGGWIDIYDYGYADAGEAAETPEEVWNEGILREYDGQITVDVNFAILMAEARKAGWKAEIETVSGRLANAFGKKFTFVDFTAHGGKKWVGYVDEEGLRGRRAELKKAGYSEEFLDGEIEEQDCYLHLRVEK